MEPRTMLRPTLASLLLLAACETPLESTARYTVDPVVLVHGQEGDELGVSTHYGIVFLGRTIQSGRAEFTVWFGDGPAREEGLVEAMGGGVYATEAEILLPAVALGFDPPPPGTTVIVRGRRAGRPYEFEAELAADARVRGLLLAPNEDLDRLADDALGAGVFHVVPGEPPQLLGLLSGELVLDESARYVTLLGPEELWRLVVHRRNSDRPRRWVYREDVM